METINVECHSCCDTHLLKVDMNKFHQWKRKELLAQVAFSHLEAPDRELLISGTCGKCWEEMFGGEEEE